MAVKRAIIVFRSFGETEEHNLVEVFKVDRIHFTGLTREGRGRTVPIFRGHHTAAHYYIAGLKDAGVQLEVAACKCQNDEDISQLTWTKCKLTWTKCKPKKEKSDAGQSSGTTATG